MLLAPLLSALPLAGAVLTIGLGASMAEYDGWTGVLHAGALIVMLIVASSLSLGIPIWLLLRALHLESQRAYILTGLLGGWVCAWHFGNAGSATVSAAECAAFGAVALIGARVGFDFWRLARPPEKR